MKIGWMIAFAGIAAACTPDHKPDPTLARMLDQRRADPLSDQMRTPPPDTVARDDDRDDTAPPLDRDLVLLGRDRYDSHCAHCHGVAGDGKSYVAERMKMRPPGSLVAPMRSRSEIFEAETEGYGMMPALSAQLSARERWAVAAYVQALALRGGK